MDKTEKIKDLQIKSGLNITQFARQLNIPLRTMQDWMAGKRNPPQYVLELIEYRISHR